MDPVRLSTANETPTSEKPFENGASSRSTSRIRKSRMASTGYRRASARHDMTSPFNVAGSNHVTWPPREPAISFARGPLLRGFLGCLALGRVSSSGASVGASAFLRCRRLLRPCAPPRVMPS